MQENVYAPPRATVADAPQAAVAVHEFYVVSPLKFAVMFFSTLGLYQFYWWYMHWARWGRFNREKVSPVGRTIFSVFYAHALNRDIDTRVRGYGYRWSPAGWAATYVVSAIVGSVAGRFPTAPSGVDWGGVVVFAALLPTGYALLQSQRAANVACGDHSGATNARLRWSNWVWIVPGGVLTILFAAGVVLAMLGKV